MVTTCFWHCWLKGVLIYREFCLTGGLCPNLLKHFLLFKNSFWNYCLLSRSSDLLSLHASEYFSWVSLPVAKLVSTTKRRFLIYILGRVTLTIVRRMPALADFQVIFSCCEAHECSFLVTLNTRFLQKIKPKLAFPVWREDPMRCWLQGISFWHPPPQITTGCL